MAANANLRDNFLKGLFSETIILTEIENLSAIFDGLLQGLFLCQQEIQNDSNCRAYFNNRTLWKNV